MKIANKSKSITSGSIKRNFVLNLSNTITALLFPLVTFPYASRILFAEGIGRVQFFLSIIDYIALCTALGIPLYAVREIARVRDDAVLRSKTTTEILLLHALLTLAGYAVVLLLAFTVAKIKVDVPLFLLLSSTLFFNAIGVAWFYQAIEDFKYITIRSLIVRIVSLVALFVFVKDKDDLFYYAAILVIANVGGNVFNFFRLRKYLLFISWKELNLWKHLKPALRIFVLNLMISIYVNLDSIMLGFLKNEQAVGFYTAATRVTKALIGLVSSLGMVLLPRFSNMISNRQLKDFRTLADKAISFILCLCLPMATGIIFMSKPIIKLFCGPDFTPSILTLQLIAPTIFFIGLSGILGMQILYPQGKEKLVIIATGTGAVINFILNYLLIPRYFQYGAAISTSIAELSVLVVIILIGKKFLPIRFISRQNLQYFLGTLLITAFLFLINHLRLDDYLKLLIGIPVSVVFYCLYLYGRKDAFALQIKNILVSKLKSHI